MHLDPIESQTENELEQGQFHLNTHEIHLRLNKSPPSKPNPKANVYKQTTNQSSSSSHNSTHFPHETYPILLSTTPSSSSTSFSPPQTLDSRNLQPPRTRVDPQTLSIPIPQHPSANSAGTLKDWIDQLSPISRLSDCTYTLTDIMSSIACSPMNSTLHCPPFNHQSQQPSSEHTEQNHKYEIAANPAIAVADSHQYQQNNKNNPIMYNSSHLKLQSHNNNNNNNNIKLHENKNSKLKQRLELFQKNMMNTISQTVKLCKPAPNNYCSNGGDKQTQTLIQAQTLSQKNSRSKKDDSSNSKNRNSLENPLPRSISSLQNYDKPTISSQMKSDSKIPPATQKQPQSLPKQQQQSQQPHRPSSPHTVLPSSQQQILPGKSDRTIPNKSARQSNSTHSNTTLISITNTQSQQYQSTSKTQQIKKHNGQQKQHTKTISMTNPPSPVKQQSIYQQYFQHPIKIENPVQFYKQPLDKQNEEPFEQIGTNSSNNNTKAFPPIEIKRRNSSDMMFAVNLYNLNQNQSPFAVGSPSTAAESIECIGIKTPLVLKPINSPLEVDNQMIHRNNSNDNILFHPLSAIPYELADPKDNPVSEEFEHEYEIAESPLLIAVASSNALPFNSNQMIESHLKEVNTKQQEKLILSDIPLTPPKEVATQNISSDSPPTLLEKVKSDQVPSKNIRSNSSCVNIQTKSSKSNSSQKGIAQLLRTSQNTTPQKQHQRIHLDRSSNSRSSQHKKETHSQQQYLSAQPSTPLLISGSQSVTSPQTIQQNNNIQIPIISLSSAVSLSHYQDHSKQQRQRTSSSKQSTKGISIIELKPNKRPNKTLHESTIEVFDSKDCYQERNYLIKTSSRATIGGISIEPKQNAQPEFFTHLIKDTFIGMNNNSDSRLKTSTPIRLVGEKSQATISTKYIHEQKLKHQQMIAKPFTNTTGMVSTSSTINNITSTSTVNPNNTITLHHPTQDLSKSTNSPFQTLTNSTYLKSSTSPIMMHLDPIKRRHVQ